MMGNAEKSWLLLIGLTLAGAWLSENGQAGWPLTFSVAFLIGFKGGVVIDHYMEMRSANTRIRAVLRSFVTIVPVLVIISHGWGEFIRDITTLN